MKRILLVDDHAMARQALKLLLEHHGYACDEAEHGIAALAWLEQGQNVDLIVSDNQMPVMTGLEFLAHVNATAHFSAIPFIAVCRKAIPKMEMNAREESRSTS